MKKYINEKLGFEANESTINLVDDNGTNHKMFRVSYIGIESTLFEIPEDLILSSGDWKEEDIQIFEHFLSDIEEFILTSTNQNHIKDFSLLLIQYIRENNKK